jgi:TP901 family phage tail tape measure protein
MALNVGTLTAILRMVDEVSPVVEKVRANTRKLGQDFKDVGAMATAGLTVPIVGAFAAAATSAIAFESSFAGVKKTVGDATDAMGNLTPVGARLSQGFRDLAKEIPVNVNELNKVGEAAGQLGIKSENILGFTRVMADLGVTTNLSSDEAASALARLANITQMPQTEFQRLGSTIVALGNNFATTEAEIVQMGLRIAGAGKQIGLTEHQIMGVAAALSSVGIEAEAGGSAISKVMIQMASAVEKGGSELELFSKIAGTDFANAFKDDAAAALTVFIKGLSDTERHGMSTLGALEALGITEVRMRDALLRASGAGDLMNRTLKTGAEAWRENTALTKEAEQRYKTFESQLALVWAQVRDVGIELGTALLPTMRSALSALTPLIDGMKLAVDAFGKLPAPLQLIVLGFFGMMAAAGPLLFITGQLIQSYGVLAGSAALGAARTALINLEHATGLATARLWLMEASAKAVSLALLKVGIAAAGVYAAYRILAEAHGLLSDRQARAAAATDEQGRRYEMMGKASEIAGRSIHTYDEAVRIVTDHLRQQIDVQKGATVYTQAAGPAAVAAAAATVNYAAQLAQLKREVAALDPAVKANITALKEMGKSAEFISEKLKISEEKVHLFLEAMKASEEATKKATKWAKDYADALEGGLAKAQDLARDSAKKMAEGQQAATDRINAAIAENVIKWKEYGDTLENDVAKRTMTALQFSIREIEQWAETQKRQLPQTGALWKENADRIDEIARKRIDALVSDDVLAQTVLFANLATNAAKRVKDLNDRAKEAALDGLQNFFTALGQIAGSNGIGKFMQAAGNMVAGLKLAHDWSKQLGQNGQALGGSMGSLSVMFNKNATGSQKFAAGLQSAATIAQGAMSVWKATSEAVGTLGKTFAGAMAGAQAGAAFGPIGAAIGAAAGALTGFLRGMFGVSAAIKQSRAEVDKFQAALHETLSVTQRQAAGGEKWKMTIIAVTDAYIAAGKSADEALAIVRQLWDTDHPDRARAAMEEIQRVMGGVKTEQEILNRAVQEYGFTIEELGPKFRNQKLSEQAQRLVEDFAVLSESGIDVGTVVTRMADKTNEYLHIALKTGTEVPRSMRPMLEKMVEMGLLTDENGEKLEDLERITWAETMTQGFDRVVGAVERLIAVIGGTLPAAAADAAGTIEHEFRNRALPALRDTAEAINDTIEMKSPTGLLGIIHYTKLAADGMVKLRDRAVPALVTVRHAVDDIADRFDLGAARIARSPLGRTLTELTGKMRTLAREAANIDANINPGGGALAGKLRELQRAVSLGKRTGLSKDLLDFEFRMSDEISQLGPDPSVYRHNFELARQAIRQQLQYMLEDLEDAKQAELKALGPIPEAYEKEYARAMAAAERANQRAIMAAENYRRREMADLDDLVRYFDGSYEKAQAYVQAEYEEMLRDAADRFQQEKDSIGPVPAEYAEIYAETVRRVETYYARMKQRAQEKTDTEIAGLGPIPEQYEQQYGAAVELIKAKYALMVEAAAKAAQETVDAWKIVEDMFTRVTGNNPGIPGGGANIPVPIGQAVEQIHALFRRAGFQNASAEHLAEIARYINYRGGDTITALDLNRALEYVRRRFRELNIPGFDTGTHGLRDFGPGTMVMLHGREEVRTEAQVRGDARPIEITVHTHLDGRQVARTVVRHMPSVLAVQGVRQQ